VVQTTINSLTDTYSEHDALANLLLFFQKGKFLVVTHITGSGDHPPSSIPFQVIKIVGIIDQSFHQINTEGNVLQLNGFQIK
jgi:hypothetical protein